MLKLEIGEHNYSESNNVTFSCQYHIVFCTKYRRNVLDERVQEKLSELLYHYEEPFKYKILYLDIKLDQVHMIIQASADTAISRLIGGVKKATVRPLVDEHPHITVGMPNLWTRYSFIATCGTVTMHDINSFVDKQSGV